MNAELVKISELIRDHLLAQHARSMTGGSCKYRAHDGKMCAVGCLIEKEFYRPEFEGHGVNAVMDAVVWSLRKRGVLNNLVVPNELDTLLGWWQEYHDIGDYVLWAAGTNFHKGPSEYHGYLINRRYTA